jgi:hypothetical protein
MSGDLPPIKEVLNSNLIFSNENDPLAGQKKLIKNIISLPSINANIMRLLYFPGIEQKFPGIDEKFDKTDFKNKLTELEKKLKPEEAEEHPKFEVFSTNIQKNIIALLDKLQVFCNEKFIFLSFIKSLIDNKIKELDAKPILYDGVTDEEAFHAKIKEFADKINKNELNELTGGSNKQIGGTKGLETLLMSVLIMFLFFNSGSGFFSNLNREPLMVNNEGNLVSIDPKNINEAIMIRPRPVVVTPVMNPLVEKYDEKQLVHMDSLKNLALVPINQIFALVVGPKNDGKKLLNDVIEDFNEKAVKFSEESTLQCKEIIQLIYENDIFLLLKNLEEVKERNKAIEDIEKEVLNAIAEEQSKESIYTGYYKYLFVPNADKNKLQQARVEEKVKNLPSVVVPEKVKHQMNMLYADAAKAMCRPALNFQLILQGDNTITIEGGKVNEYEIRALLLLLKENIKTELNALNNDPNDPKSLALNSLQQRLSVLDELIHELHTMTQLTIYEKIEEILRNPRGDSIETLNKFLNDELNNLNKILDNLKKQFPLAHQRIQILEQMVEEQKKIVIEEAEILKVEAEMKAIDINARANASAITNDAKNKVFNEKIEKNMNFAGDMLAKVAEGAVGIAGKPIVAMSTELFSTFSKLIFTMLGSTGGWAAMGVLGIVLYIQGMTVFGFAYRLTKNIIVFVVKSSKGIIIYAFKIIGKSFIFLGSFFIKKRTDGNEQPNNNNNIEDNNNNNEIDFPGILMSLNNTVDNDIKTGASDLLRLNDNPPNPPTPPTGGKKQTKKGRRSKNKKNKSRKHHKKSKKQKKH